MKLRVNFKPEQPFKLGYGEIQKVVEYVGGELYEGDYSVTSSTEQDIILPTAQKVLEQNIKVNKIPYAEVKNTKGGQTATIG